ncbi:transcriptional repressor p66-beta-like [Centruroides vittatus]|uniref:transcriptional repressor p66-beta-like n=1 Tax=Centruroides vittatus TaxID=120091 RepID=UPI0035106F75
MSAQCSDTKRDLKNYINLHSDSMRTASRIMTSNRDSSYHSNFPENETIDLSIKRKVPVELETNLEGPSSSGKSNKEIGVVIKKRKSLSFQYLDKSHVRSQPSRAARYTESYSLSASSSPDVVVLSDEENMQLNGHVNGFESDSRPESSDSEAVELPLPPLSKELTKEEYLERQKKIWKLREKLRTEEMKLVLLKKLHQSQLMKETLLNSSGTISGKLSSTGRVGIAPTTPPPPLVRSSHMSSHSKTSMQHHNQQSSLMARGQTGPPPLVITGRGPNSLLQQSVIRPGIGSRSTPPNVVMAYNLQGHQGSQASSVLNQTSTSPSAHASGSERMDNQTPAQRQAAAKLALRKQLEKTLLQIPPPKPPPPEMHFIPNANNQEFICLLGLEKVVDSITDGIQDGRAPPEPFECVQCGTDFTPVWKWQESRGKQPSVICEICVTSNIKKALKAEHTNRLKTAFVKALQQEQEIEQRMSQAAVSPPPPSTTPHNRSSTPTSIVVSSSGQQSVSNFTSSHSPVHGSLSRISSSAVANSSALLQHMPKLSVAHQSLLQAQAQQLQQLAHQPQPAHMIPFAPMLAAQAYSYQMLGKSPITSADIQRQYLLDMIPPCSLPQGTLNWKT